MLRKVPLIVILGATGTGKTKLSVELAERFGSEIISADSMQVYANLNVVTAKATEEERDRVKHHLLDVATPHQPFTVFQYRNEALPIIENLLACEKSPIIVGGTNYYIESLLWDVLINTAHSTSPSSNSSSSSKANSLSNLATSATCGVENASDSKAATSGNFENSSFISQSEMPTMSSEFLHNHLRKIDSEMANRIHPNNKRKIIRAIEYYQESGETLSSKIKEQRQQPGGNRLGGPIRYPHTILLWLKCNQDVLNCRLEKRIDAMLAQGLLPEIRAFYNEHKPKPGADRIAFTKGILQSIGFKEFIPYLEQFSCENDKQIEEYLKANAYKMPMEEQFKSNIGHGPLPAGLDVLNHCLNELKLVTRRYSKKQLKWINNRYLASKDRQVPFLYELDTTDVEQWHEMVYRKAVKIIDSYSKASTCEIEPLSKKVHPSAGLNEEITNVCSICQRTFIGEYQWQLHLKSNKHKRRKDSQRKKEKLKKSIKME